jgi:DNA-binding SARP family transcriptional activator
MSDSMAGTSPRLEIRLLGRFSVRRDGQEIPVTELGGRLGRALIRILLTRRGAVVPVDVLAEALWPDRQPADPAANVAVLLSRVRRAVESPKLIVAATGGYLFSEGESCVIDAEAFLIRAQRGSAYLDSLRADAALAEFRAALKLWGGEPLPEDVYADWSREYREQLLRSHMHVLEGGAKAALERGDAQFAERLAAQAVAREPLREEGHLLLMRALAASGNQAAALAAFDALKSVLAAELAVEPTRDASALRQEIAAGHLTRRRFTARPAKRATPAEQSSAPLAFVGRRAELDAIDALLVAPEPTVVVVTGPGGSGKSRLLAEAAARSHLPWVGAHAFRSESQEAWGVARTLLREAVALDPDAVRRIPDAAAGALTDLVPEIAELRPLRDVEIDPESRRALLFEGGARVLLAALGEHGVIVIDDLQWADVSSLELVARVMRRGARIDLILACRTAEVAGEPPAGFLATLGDATTIHEARLGALSLEAISELVDDERLARAIAEETDGTPLAVSEVLGRLRREGAVVPGPRGRWRSISAEAGERGREAARAGQRDAIRRRVSRLTPRCRKVLRLLAVLGREVPARMLTRALGTGERQVLEALDLLFRSELVRAGEAGWAVSHDVIAEAVVEGLHRGERAQLHAVLAETLLLEAVDPATIAQHQLLAGDRERAAGSLARAARANLDRFAHVEAGRLAEEGLAIEPGRESRAELLAVRAEVRARSGDLVGAREDLRALLVLNDPGPDRSRVLGRMAMLASGSEDFTVAADLGQLALAEAGLDQRARAQALTTAAIVAINLNDLERAQAWFEEALQLFQRLGDARGAADIIDGRAMAAWAAGRIREAAEAMDHVARLFSDAGELLRVGFPRASRGTLLHWLARPAEGLADADEALALERTLGNVDGECYALCSRSGTLLGLTRAQEALADAATALVLARRVGHREWISYAHWNIGQAKLELADPAGAEAAFAAGLEAAHHMPIFASVNASGMAMALTRRGELHAARQYAERALAEGTPQTVYEGRLAAAELAVASADASVGQIIRDSIAQAERGGHLLSLPRLRALAARL